jgi:menaquinone-dependent protoporphyrinogen oxidase
MSQRILITYFTESGSTRQAAEVIDERLKETEHLQIDTCAVTDVSTVNGYDLVIIGTPNWFGKPAPKIQDLIKSNQRILKNTQTAMFFTCMSLSEITGDTFENISIFKDPVFENAPNPLEDMTMWEKSHAISYYLKKIKKVAPEFVPIALAFFKGNLNYSKLSFSHRMIMKFISWFNKDVNEGDYLNEDALRKWSTLLLNVTSIREH